MRELKFRCWSPYRKMDYYELHEIAKINQIIPFTNGWHWMQYTGSKDKNGTEIYEGDLVRIGETYMGDSRIPPYIADVYFENGNFNVSGEASYDSLCVNTYNWEVVGNIYENPELIEE